MTKSKKENSNGTDSNEITNYMELLGISVPPSEEEEFLKQLKIILAQSRTRKELRFRTLMAHRIIHNDKIVKDHRKILIQSSVNKICRFYEDKFTYHQGEKLGWDFEYGIDGNLDKKDSANNKSNKHDVAKRNNNMNKIKWKGSKRDLLQLVYALKYADQIEIDGDTSDKAVSKAFLESMGVTISQPNKELSEMAIRNSDLYDEITPLFMTLDNAWKKYCNNKMKKKEQRK